MKAMWCKFQCGWNWLLSKLLFDVSSCPYKLCSCNTKVKKRKKVAKKSKGLGDSIQKLTKATGVEKVVKKSSYSGWSKRLWM